MFNGASVGQSIKDVNKRYWVFRHSRVWLKPRRLQITTNFKMSVTKFKQVSFIKTLSKWHLKLRHFIKSSSEFLRTKFKLKITVAIFSSEYFAKIIFVFFRLLMSQTRRLNQRRHSRTAPSPKKTDSSICKSINSDGETNYLNQFSCESEVFSDVFRFHLSSAFSFCSFQQKDLRSSNAFA